MPRKKKAETTEQVDLFPIEEGKAPEELILPEEEQLSLDPTNEAEDAQKEETSEELSSIEEPETNNEPLEEEIPNLEEPIPEVVDPVKEEKPKKKHKIVFDDINPYIISILLLLIFGLTTAMLTVITMDIANRPQIVQPKDGKDGQDGAPGEKGEAGKDGEDGLPGNPGIDGSSFIQGFDDPTNDVGNDGDSYLNSTTYDMFYKHNGVWSKVGNIKGPGSEQVEYTVSFDTDGGTTLEPLKVKAGEKLPEISIPTRGNDMFAYWSLPTGETFSSYNDPGISNIYSVTSDITLTAHYDTRGERLYNNILKGTELIANMFPSKTPYEKSASLYTVTVKEEDPGLTLLIKYIVNYAGDLENLRTIEVGFPEYESAEELYEAILNDASVMDTLNNTWSRVLRPDTETFNITKMRDSLNTYLEGEGFSYHPYDFNSTPYTKIRLETSTLAYDFDNDRYCSYDSIGYNFGSDYEIIETNLTKNIAEPGSLAYDLYDVISYL